MKKRLDELDIAILRLKQEDATLVHKQIGAKLYKSDATICNRIKRLHQNKVIKAEKAVIDPAMVGIETIGCIYLKVHIESDKTMEHLKTTFLKIRGLLSCSSITGRASIKIRIAVKNMRTFNQIKEGIASIPNVVVTDVYVELEDIIPFQGLDF